MIFYKKARENCDGGQTWKELSDQLVYGALVGGVLELGGVHPVVVVHVRLKAGSTQAGRSLVVIADSLTPGFHLNKTR